MSNTRLIPTDLSKLLKPFAGEWVTLSRDESHVVGHGGTIDEAINQAHKKGEKHPVLIKSPDSNTALLL